MKMIRKNNTGNNGKRMAVYGISECLTQHINRCFLNENGVPMISDLRKEVGSSSDVYSAVIHIRNYRQIVGFRGCKDVLMHRFFIAPQSNLHLVGLVSALQ